MRRTRERKEYHRTPFAPKSNQGLQETGIGIYFKEDFNNAKDLRLRLKNRFKREKKGAEATSDKEGSKDVKTADSVRVKRRIFGQNRQNVALQPKEQGMDAKSENIDKQQTK